MMLIVCIALLVQSLNFDVSFAATTLQCYKCSNAVDLSECSSVTCDASIEDCYMESSVTDAGRTVYNAGCRSSIICQAYGSSGSIVSGISGKRSPISSCYNCCHSDKCNNNLCGIPPGNVPYAPTCYACDSRVRNYAQSEVLHPDDCVHKTVCAPNEVCVAEVSVIGVKPYHYFGCMRKLQCQYLMNGTFESMVAQEKISGSQGKRQIALCHACCGDSDCNHQDCYKVRENMYSLYKANLLDFDSLRKKTTS